MRGLVDRCQTERNPLAPSHGEVQLQPSQGPGNLQLRDLWVDLEAFHLREIDLDVAAGEYFVVLGPTGAGKTVLLETIAGLFHPRKGHIVMDGRDITEVPPEHRGIGFVYQDYVLFPHLTVAENIAFGLKLRKDRGGLRSMVRLMLVPQKAADLSRRSLPSDTQGLSIEDRVVEISQLLSIDHLLDRSPTTLSGGERQRAALARALVVEPRLLLLDEPLSALDPDTREGLQRELARLQRELGTTTLHVTHDFEEAVALGSRIAVVHQGRIVQVGTPEDIFRRPANEFVARFVGVRNVFAGTVLEEREDGYRTFKSGDLEIVVVTDLTGVAHASVRPEDIIISRDPLRAGVRNRFRGRIVDVADRGTLIYVTVKGAAEFICVVTRRSLEEMGLIEDKEVHIAFKASAVHVF